MTAGLPQKDQLQKRNERRWKLQALFMAERAGRSGVLIGGRNFEDIQHAKRADNTTKALHAEQERNLNLNLFWLKSGTHPVGRVRYEIPIPTYRATST